MGTKPDLEAIHAAHERIRAHIHHTPVLTCATLDGLAGASLFFKCENFQKAGAFKSRGACNAVFSLSATEAAQGVVTHSSGNHAAALARAAAIRGIAAHIVMPTNAPAIKRAAVEAYGGRITPCEPTLEARETTAAKVQRETGAVMVHPYDDERIIAGQGTAALELIEEVPDLDFILAPVGGGGLLSGTAIVAKASMPGIRVIGCEPALADDAYRGFREGRLCPVLRTDTVADGLRTALGEKTFPIVRELVDRIILAEEIEIIRAMRLTWERMKIVIEPSSAVPLAALLDAELDTRAKRIGIILTGGNVDLDRIPSAD